MSGILGVTLALALTTQLGGPTVAIILQNKTLIVERSVAEAWNNALQREDEPALKAALEIALGTSPGVSAPTGAEDLTPAEREHFRWLRLPLQRAKRN